MLTIIVKGDEVYDETTQEFDTKGDVVLELEHSLVSLSKWESKHEKAFLGKDEKTREEVLDYILDMIVSENPPAGILDRLSADNYRAINEYVEAKMTATWFNEPPNQAPQREVVTSELIYYWMISYTIPFECQYWHLSRLLTLIKVCNVKNAPAKKSSSSEIAARNRELNAQRRAKYKTNG